MKKRAKKRFPDVRMRRDDKRKLRPGIKKLEDYDVPTGHNRLLGTSLNDRPSVSFRKFEEMAEIAELPAAPLQRENAF
jgi:hypothetical protein